MEQIRMFSARGHDVLLEYDPATASMEEVNQVVDRIVKETGGKAFSFATGEQVTRITPDTQDVHIVTPIAGG